MVPGLPAHESVVTRHGYIGKPPVWVEKEETPIKEGVGIKAMGEAVNHAQMTEAVEFLKERGIDFHELMGDSQELLTTLMSLASGGGVCMSCHCKDCEAKLDEEIAHDLGRKTGLTAMKEAIDASEDRG
jgi:hypothetical protein